ncbi:MAG: DUF4926 domain-containing protein [Balneolaceae bacterium]|nr:DUF4926 domain-containing protein [Balneolaceae bacterium]MCH8547409.1 DUF4926 domain-containing protein [Balneolaceae bacterium]
MKFELYSEVVLLRDFKEKHLRKGDLATVVDRHDPVKEEFGYTLEVFNAVGDTITVLTVKESEIEHLNENDMLNVRKIESA